MSSIKEAFPLALQQFEKARGKYLAGEADSTEGVLDAARAILAAGGWNGETQPVSLASEHEKPSDFLQRVMWAESVLSPILVVAVQLELFQKLRDAGPAGVTTDSLSIRSPYHRHQLDRILRHLKASSVIDVLRPSVWLATSLSNELATPHFQHSILFCHYTTRQAFNGLPEYFSRMSKEDPSAVPGPFQIGMESPLGFFPWLAANPKQATYFNHFMQAYRAGNAMWFEPGFYPNQKAAEGNTYPQLTPSRR